MIFLVSVFLPADYSVKRSIEINAKPSEIYPYLDTIRHWNRWSVWSKRVDSSIMIAYRGSRYGSGAAMMWYGRLKGSGQLEITISKPDTLMKYYMILEDGHFESSGYIRLDYKRNSTKVTWYNEGSVYKNPILKYFIILTDGFMGAEFERSLGNLKELVEEGEVKTANEY